MIDVVKQPKPPRPKQISISKKKWKELFELVKWYESTPKQVGKSLGDYFHEDIQERISDLINFDDETDTYYACFFELRGKKVYTLLFDQTTEKESWIPVVAK